MSSVGSLQELRAELHKAFADTEPSERDMRQLLEAYNSAPSDWKKYVTWSDQHYTRNLVDRGNDKFNLIVLCWAPSQGSAIHDHSNSHCMVKVLQGQLRETLFKMPPPDVSGEMVQTDQSEYHQNQVTYIHDDQGVVHRMENPSHTEGTVSLHLYTPPLMLCHTFDDRTSHRQDAKVTFHTVDGVSVAEGVNQCSERCCGDQ